MRLIDAEKLPLEPKEANQFIPYEYASGWNDMLLNVLKAEQIDAVPVARCRDCEHRTKLRYDGKYHCFNADAGMATGVELNDNDFCSHGERKEGAGNA